MEDLKKEFQDKNFDEKALEFIINFINEFDDLFGKYVSREELIRRIKENLDLIVFSYEFENKEYRGTYNIEEKKIRLADLESEEQLKGVFFHEMIHCITTNKERTFTGFERIVEDIENEEKTTSRGLAEGFTAYSTKKRNEKYGANNIDSYPILTEQIENIIDLIGEDTFLDIAFNRPEDITIELGFEKNESISMDEISFYEAFETIWSHERQINFIRQYGKDNIQLLYEDANSLNEKYNIIGIAKRIIIDAFKKILLRNEIRNIEEFNFVYLQISKYAEQLDMEKSMDLYESLFEQISNIEQLGYTREEILDGLTEEAKIIFKAKKYLEEFENLSDAEKLKLISEESFGYELGIYDTCFENDFLNLLTNKIVPIQNEDYAISFFLFLRMGLAKIIEDRGYNINTLSIEFIDFYYDFNEKNTPYLNVPRIFNLYDCGEDKIIYLGTFYENDGEVSQLLPEGKESKVYESYQELKGAVVYKTETGEIIAYTGNDRYTQVIDEGRVFHFEGFRKYYRSRLEILREELAKKMSLVNRYGNR